MSSVVSEVESLYFFNACDGVLDFVALLWGSCLWDVPVMIGEHDV